MENNHNIDKTFNEASKTLEEPATFPGFEKVWSTIEERLDKKQEKKKIFPIWLPYGIAASLLIASGVFYFNNQKENTEIAKPVIAESVVESKMPVKAVPENIRKIDSTVKANIQSEILPAAPAKIAYHTFPKVTASSLASPVVVAPAQPSYDEEPIAVADYEKVSDTLKSKNIEEVKIAMGLKKDKVSMINAEGLASSEKKKISDLNAIADTAELIEPIDVFDLKQQAREPKILAYNKKYIKTQKPVAATSAFGEKIGSNGFLNSIHDVTPGVNVNSISGKPGSGKVDILITCQNSVKPEMNPLVVIDGQVSDMETLKKLDPKKIENISVIKKEKAAGLFSGKAQNGLLVVITKDISKKEKRKLKKLLKKELPQK